MEQRIVLAVAIGGIVLIAAAIALMAAVMAGTFGGFVHGPFAGHAFSPLAWMVMWVAMVLGGLGLLALLALLVVVLVRALGPRD